MKNIAAVLFCIGLCITMAFLYPQVGISNEMVNATDDDACLTCHELGTAGMSDETTLHGLHPELADCSTCHEDGMITRGTVSSASCLACHPIPLVDAETCELVDSHAENPDYDPTGEGVVSCLTAGCHIEACEEPTTTTTTEPAGCAVTIDCDDTELCPDDECATCTATTECDGMEADGVYSWSLNMEAATGDNGSIEICPEALNDGDNTLMVTDTANDNAEDTEMIQYNGTACQGPTECLIDVIRDDFPKSNWTPLYPVLIRIEVTGDFRDDLNFFSKITIECDSDDNGLFPAILQTGKVIVPSLGTNTTEIWQTALIWPALLTGNFGEESETCTLQVAGCDKTDDFELDILSVFGIPASK